RTYGVPGDWGSLGWFTGSGPNRHQWLPLSPALTRFGLFSTVGGWEFSLFCLSRSAVSFLATEAESYNPRRGTPMQNLQMERIAVLEKRQRLSLAVNVVLITLLVVAAGEFAREVHAQQKQDAKTLVLSELTIVDSHGVVRARLGGNLPDANKTTPRGSRIAC